MSNSKTLKKGDCGNVHKKAYSMFTIQSIFIILLIVVFSIFHSFFSTLMFSIMISRPIGMVSSMKLYSIVLLTISVSSISTGSMPVVDLLSYMNILKINEWDAEALIINMIGQCPRFIDLINVIGHNI